MAKWLMGLTVSLTILLASTFISPAKAASDSSSSGSSTSSGTAYGTTSGGTWVQNSKGAWTFIPKGKKEVPPPSSERLDENTIVVPGGTFVNVGGTWTEGGPIDGGGSGDGGGTSPPPVDDGGGTIATGPSPEDVGGGAGIDGGAGSDDTSDSGDASGTTSDTGFDPTQADHTSERFKEEHQDEFNHMRLDDEYSHLGDSKLWEMLRDKYALKKLESVPPPPPPEQSVGETKNFPSATPGGYWKWNPLTKTGEWVSGESFVGGLKESDTQLTTPSETPSTEKPVENTTKAPAEQPPVAEATPSEAPTSPEPPSTYDYSVSGTGEKIETVTIPLAERVWYVDDRGVSDFGAGTLAETSNVPSSTTSAETSTAQASSVAVSSEVTFAVLDEALTSPTSEPTPLTTPASNDTVPVIPFTPSSVLTVNSTGGDDTFRIDSSPATIEQFQVATETIPETSSVEPVLAVEEASQVSSVTATFAVPDKRSTSLETTPTTPFATTLDTLTLDGPKENDTVEVTPLISSLTLINGREGNDAVTIDQVTTASPSIIDNPPTVEEITAEAPTTPGIPILEETTETIFSTEPLITEPLKEEVAQTPETLVETPQVLVEQPQVEPTPIPEITVGIPETTPEALTVEAPLPESVETPLLEPLTTTEAQLIEVAPSETTTPEPELIPTEIPTAEPELVTAMPEAPSTVVAASSLETLPVELPPVEITPEVTSFNQPAQTEPTASPELELTPIPESFETSLPTEATTLEPEQSAVTSEPVVLTTSIETSPTETPAIETPTLETLVEPSTTEITTTSSEIQTELLVTESVSAPLETLIEQPQAEAPSTDVIAPSDLTAEMLLPEPLATEQLTSELTTTPTLEALAEQPLIEAAPVIEPLPISDITAVAPEITSELKELAVTTTETLLPDPNLATLSAEAPTLGDLAKQVETPIDTMPIIEPLQTEIVPETTLELRKLAESTIAPEIPSTNLSTETPTLEALAIDAQNVSISTETQLALEKTTSESIIPQTGIAAETARQQLPAFEPTPIEAQPITLPTEKAVEPIVETKALAIDSIVQPVFEAPKIEIIPIVEAVVPVPVIEQPVYTRSPCELPVMAGPAPAEGSFFSSSSPLPQKELKPDWEQWRNNKGFIYRKK